MSGSKDPHSTLLDPPEVSPEEFDARIEQRLAQLQKARDDSADNLPQQLVLWLSLVPKWTEDLIEGVARNFGRRGGPDALPSQLATMENLGWLERRTSTPLRNRPSVPDVLYLTPEVADKQLGARPWENDPLEVWRVIHALGEAILSVDSLQTDQGIVPPITRRWAALAATAKPQSFLANTFSRRSFPPFWEPVAQLLDDKVRSSSTGEAQRWIEAAQHLAAVLARDGETSLDLAIRRGSLYLELQDRRRHDLKHLANFLPRHDQIEALRRLLKSEGDASASGTWALHLLGNGGVGKTMLVRHLTAQLANIEHWSLSVARVDFDFLSPDYPRLDPGLLLWAFAQELQLYDPSGRVRLSFESAERSFRHLRQLLQAGEFSERPASEHDLFLEGLEFFAQGLELLPHPVVLVVDTCEELTKPRSDLDSRFNVDETFRILQLLHERLPSLRVVFAGRRPLAEAGQDWRIENCSLPPRPFLALFEMRGFTHDEARQSLAQKQVPSHLVDAVVQRSTPDAGGIAGIEYLQGEGPAVVERCNPYELNFLAEWALDTPPPEPEDIEKAGGDRYVELRILHRLRNPQVAALLPILGVVRHVDETLLAALSGLADQPLADLMRDLRGQEWVEQHTGRRGDETRPILSVEEGLRLRLLSYFAHRPSNLAAHRLIAIAVLQRRLLNDDPNDLEKQDFDAALRATGPAPDGDLWWRQVEERFFELRDGAWWLQQIEYLDGSDGAVCLPDETSWPELRTVHPLRPAVLATQALTENQNIGRGLTAWMDVADSASKLPHIGPDLDVRARAMVQVGKRDVGQEITPGDAQDLWHAMSALTDAPSRETAAALVAAAEAMVEQAEEHADTPGSYKVLASPPFDDRLEGWATGWLLQRFELFDDLPDAPPIAGMNRLLAMLRSLDARVIARHGPDREKAIDLFRQAIDEVGGTSSEGPQTTVPRGSDEVGGTSSNDVTKGFDEVGGTSSEDTSSEGPQTTVPRGSDEVGGTSSSDVSKGSDEVGGTSSSDVSKGSDEVGGTSPGGRQAPFWLTWREPQRLVTRLRIEAIRALVPNLLSPDDGFGQFADLRFAGGIERDRSMAQLVGLGLASGLDSAPFQILKISESDNLVYEPVCRAHHEIPPFAVARAQVLASQGHFDQAWLIFEDIARRADSYSAEHVRQAARAELELAIRLRYFETEPGHPLATSGQDQSLLDLAEALGQGPFARIPFAVSDSRRASHDAWKTLAEPSQERLEEQVAIASNRLWRQNKKATASQNSVLDLWDWHLIFDAYEAALLLGDEDKTAAVREMAEQLTDVPFPFDAEGSLRLLLRQRALASWPSGSYMTLPDSPRNPWQSLARQVGHRRAGLIAWQEAEHLALRHPPTASFLFSVARQKFAETADPINEAICLTAEFCCFATTDLELVRPRLPQLDASWQKIGAGISGRIGTGRIYPILRADTNAPLSKHLRPWWFRAAILHEAARSPEEAASVLHYLRDTKEPMLAWTKRLGGAKPKESRHKAPASGVEESGATSRGVDLKPSKPEKTGSFNVSLGDGTSVYIESKAKDPETSSPKISEQSDGTVSSFGSSRFRSLLTGLVAWTLTAAIFVASGWIALSIVPELVFEIVREFSDPLRLRHLQPINEGFSTAAYVALALTLVTAAWLTLRVLKFILPGSEQDQLEVEVSQGKEPPQKDAVSISGRRVRNRLKLLPWPRWKSQDSPLSRLEMLQGNDRNAYSQPAVDEGYSGEELGTICRKVASMTLTVYQYPEIPWEARLAALARKNSLRSRRVAATVWGSSRSKAPRQWPNKPPQEAREPLIYVSPESERDSKLAFHAWGSFETISLQFGSPPDQDRQSKGRRLEPSQSLYFSAEESKLPQVVHLMGTIIDTSAGLRFRILSHSGEPKDLQPEDVPSLFREASLVILQESTVLEMNPRSAADRRQAGWLRIFAHRLNGAGVPAAVTLPHMTPDTASRCIQQLDRLLNRRRSWLRWFRRRHEFRDLSLLKTVDKIRRIVQKDPNMDDEAAWDVVLYSPPGWRNPFHTS